MSTTLQDFQRTMRDEPYFNIYKHRLWLGEDKVSIEEVTAWLKQRYVKSRTKNRYRVYTYPHNDGGRYVDRVLLENVTDAELIFIKMKWGISDSRVHRGERVPRIKLTADQRVARDAIVKRALDEYYASIGF